MLDFKKSKINFNKKNNNNINLILKYLPCFLIGELIIIAGIFVLSLAYYKIPGSNSYLYYFTFLIVGFGSFITGKKTYKRLGGRGFLSGILGTLPIALINLLITYLFSLKNADFFILLILPISILCGAVGGVLASNSKIRY